MFPSLPSNVTEITKQVTINTPFLKSAVQLSNFSMLELKFEPHIHE